MDLKEIYRRWREPHRRATFYRSACSTTATNHKQVARELLDDALRAQGTQSAASQEALRREDDAAHAAPDKEVVSNKQVTNARQRAVSPDGK